MEFQQIAQDRETAPLKAEKTAKEVMAATRERGDNASIAINAISLLIALILYVSFDDTLSEEEKTWDAIRKIMLYSTSKEIAILLQDLPDIHIAKRYSKAYCNADSDTRSKTALFLSSKIASPKFYQR